jgi:hypothetical protein
MRAKWNIRRYRPCPGTAKSMGGSKKGRNAPGVVLADCAFKFDFGGGRRAQLELECATRTDLNASEVPCERRTIDTTGRFTIRAARLKQLAAARRFRR